MLETGANRCCISNKIANECNLKIKQSKTTLKLAQGYSNITNTAVVEIYIPKVKAYIETEALVLYDSHEDITLGINEIKKLNIDINTIFDYKNNEKHYDDYCKVNIETLQKTDIKTYKENDKDAISKIDK